LNGRFKHRICSSFSDTQATAILFGCRFLLTDSLVQPSGFLLARTTNQGQPDRSSHSKPNPEFEPPSILPSVVLSNPEADRWQPAMPA
jgi:hypothetical protein